MSKEGNSYSADVVLSIEGVKKYFPGDKIVAYQINEIKRKLSDS